MYELHGDSAMSEMTHGPHPQRPRRKGEVIGSGIRYSRGYLPHYELSAKIQMVTYRLADALPGSVVERLKRKGIRDAKQDEYRRQVENYMDAGHGACWLAKPAMAAAVRDAWLYFDQQRYFLHAWVIMPNHVHLLLAENPPWTLSSIVKSWKGYSARKINQILGRQGTVWQRDYWDRYIRNREHYENAKQYIYENPMKTGLVDRGEQWKWSSWNEAKTKGEEPV